jgi:hypothetical protein
VSDARESDTDACNYNDMIELCHLLKLLLVCDVSVLEVENLS